MKKLIKICEYIAFIVFIVISLFTRLKLTTFLAIPIFIGVYFICKKLKIKNYALFIFIISLVTRIISTLILKVEIADDFKTMYDAALSLLKGDLSFMQGTYFRTYTYQLGLVLFEVLFLKVVRNVLILKIVNSVITSFIVLLIYLIIKELFKETTARFLSLVYLFYLYPVYLNSVLTNQHIQSALMLLVVYLIICKEEDVKLFIIIALLLGISNFFRTESIIFILGITIYQLVYINKNNYKKKIKYIGTLLITYFLMTSTLNFILFNTPLFKTYKEDKTLIKNVTYWKFYCGLNVDTNGLYNDKDAERYFGTLNEKELLIGRIKRDYKKYPLLFLKKEVILWTQTNYDLRIKNNWNRDIGRFLLNFNQGYLNLVILLFVVSLCPARKEAREEEIFIKILLALYFGVYLFIEIQPRYAYIIHMLIFLILGLSIERIEKMVKGIKRRKAE